ncbi:multidrug ABC transporter substrate-binding protein [Candidatus Peregrinibacteria bacterium CG10_big_fil_rev_8_21_14_0_10_49_24]|nr:MAG: multidrug ABC transporter substrate-binding protein [Candidatus Peregrinibacteria bacterium CG11_big_fil_rev_8_21_14_0_20_49_14]PIR50692.1 MAG: multidrug ABC transporter substrate-binding protein [Candidatus Peregrinibacteria bacterium CG10_big_fil_rev_8_21_14_0_10_49_24]PJA67454.1 MAG: multidrug ABC transporter substrate-binding protein [Candidatus Peregrinibacteria bacterium CG_4_9_14_3_um_filter_49_12]
MLLRDTIHTARKALSTNKNRSALTMLGVIIGVGSVVLMTSVGASMEGLILGQISSIGAKSMIIFPGQQEGSQGTVTAGFDSLTFEDVDALSRLKTVTSIGPGMFVDIATAIYGREETEPRVIGTVPNYFKNRDMPAALGRTLDDRDILGAKHVAVIGSEIASDLFQFENPVGKRIKLGDLTYTVVGVLEPIGTQFFQNADEFVFIPLSTARSVTGQKYLNMVSLQSVGDFDLAESDVKSLLRQRHGIVNPKDDSDKDDFIVRTSKQANDILGSVSLGLTAFITTIAAISLIVGGIGIMNIMLVAVTERTREIGLRKAVGARKADIMLQFLIEAILLTVIAGIIGVILGIAISGLTAAIVNKFLDTYDFAVSVPAIFLALIMAVVTGIVFGIYPARQASKLSPMTALRYE